MSVLDKLNAATKGRRTYTLCLDAGAQIEHDQYAAQLEDAAVRDAQAGSLAAASPNLTAVVDKMEAVRERMLASQVTFELEQMEWTKRVALQALHPARPKNVVDQTRGYNVETFLPAIIRACTVSIEDADGDKATEIPDASWANLFAALNFGSMNRLAGMVLSMNDQDPEVPTSARSLLESQDSGASLAQPDPGKAPARSASKAGSRPGSRRTSTTKKAAASAP